MIDETDEPHDLDAIRRIDVRLLVAGPEPRKVLLVGRIDRLLREGAARLGPAVSLAATPGPRGEACEVDVVIAREPPLADLLAACRSLRPGGLVYLELDRTTKDPVRRGSSALFLLRARRTMRQAGIVGLGTRWHWPSIHDCLEVVPLGAPGALLLSTARRRHNRVSRLKALAARILARLRLLDLVVSGVSVIGTRPADAIVASGPDAAGPSAGRAGTEQDGEAALARIARRSLVVTPRFRASRHAVLLDPTARGAIRSVVKVALLPRDTAGLAREAAALAAAASSPVQGSIPALVSWQSSGLPPWLEQTPVEGRPIRRPSDADARARLLADAVDWLIALPRSPAAADTSLVTDPIAELRRAAGGQREVSALIARTEALVAPLVANPPRAILMHGDFAPPNVLRRPGGDLGVIDWELAEVRGLPLVDLVFFASWLFDGASGFGGPTPPDTALAGALVRYSELVEVPPAILVALFVATWLRWAALQVARTGGGPTALEDLAGTRHLERWRQAVEAAESGRVNWMTASA